MFAITSAPVQNVEIIQPIHSIEKRRSHHHLHTAKESMITLRTRNRHLGQDHMFQHQYRPLSPCILSRGDYGLMSFSTPQKHDGPHKAELSDLTALTSDEAPADTLERKLLRSEPLEREEFYALKQIHCAQVQSKEEELLRLQHLPQERTNEISILRKALDYLYQTYEEILETARPVNEYSVILAHRILLADAYLFHARIKQTNRRSQRKLYHMAVEIYGDLLGLARRCLPPDDTSLLSIAERLSLILRESRSLKPSLILEVTSVLDDAELSLKGESNAEAERKIGQARQNLGALGANYYLHI
ncbi:unnamed protein product [Heligmosomoides polygyrus]|uniref:14-3-3 protein n=1 Tax=Heligmosomoides polygyrus TaxID=6339 RepID=A0A3P8B7W4_HELPZ|nr:unnamed protein product [Heligmosomoides polygyrus]